ncbi:MAG: glutamyl-tRNA reductase [Lentisphaeraceae bacterium]|nr:glutamyl-tRNA reductase [Lentisphaeraceae bacterium]
MSFFSIIGLNHKTAPVDLREKLAFAGEKYEQAITQLSNESDIEELVLLSTCNRTEFLYRSDHNGKDKILDFLSKTGSTPVNELKDFLYILDEFEALQHLFRVASGLNSLVIGETQILGQVKTAFEDAMDRKSSGNNFLQIYQQMLQCAKAVRRGTEIGKGSLSVSFIAVQLAKNIFSSFHDKKVLLIGAGEMCELAGVHFNEAGVQSINVANRSIDNAKKLADKFGGKSYLLTELEEAAKDSDIILASTGSPDFVLTKELVGKITPKRTHPLFLIDIAVPRDIDPKVEEFNDVFLYNIDALNKIAQENQQARNHAVKKADDIVLNKIEDYKKGQYTANLGPVITSLKKRSEEIKQEELAKLWRKNAHFTDEDKKVIERCLSLVVNKIQHDPIISLRENVQKEQSSRIITVFKDFFNL